MNEKTNIVIGNRLAFKRVMKNRKERFMQVRLTILININDIYDIF